MIKLWDKTDYRSLPKWKYLCEQNGLKGPYVEHFWRDYARTDVQVLEKDIKAHYMPIFSKEGGTYQFDTWDRPGHYFLVLININTKKAYAYKMQGKNSSFVLSALEQFFSEVSDVKVLSSDQDSAYMSKAIQAELKKRKIKHVCTNKNNHHTLGVINRLMRTLRDLLGGPNREFSNEEMQEKVEEYNNMIHASTGVAPNKMDAKAEREYIAKMTEKAKMVMNYNIKQGDWVRRVTEKDPMKKRRTNVTFEKYWVKRQEGFMFVIQAQDKSIEKVPGFKLVKVSPKDLLKYPWADSLGNERDATIIAYDKDRGRYHIHREGDPETEFEEVALDNLREHPYELSREEKIYWVSTCPDLKGIPNSVLAQVPKQEEPHVTVGMKVLSTKSDSSPKSESPKSGAGIVSRRSERVPKPRILYSG
jgi:hypothetical protein